MAEPHYLAPFKGTKVECNIISAKRKEANISGISSRGGVYFTVGQKRTIDLTKKYYFLLSLTLLVAATLILVVFLTALPIIISHRNALYLCSNGERPNIYQGLILRGQGAFTIKLLTD